jgi:hypothetical protein
MTNDNNNIRLRRRAFLKNGTLVLTAASFSSSTLPADTLAKLEEAARQFEQNKPSFLVELGDLIDAADSVDMERDYLRTIHRPFTAICKDRHTFRAIAPNERSAFSQVVSRP